MLDIILRGLLFMKKTITFAEQILKFNERLSRETFDMPNNYKIINPFNGSQKEEVKKITNAFYQKYYNDVHTRRIIFGSSPARRGSAIIGIPFETAEHLQKETDIFINKFYINKSSANFLFDVIHEYGGCKKFYYDFYMNFVFPLGIAKLDSSGKEMNCNYYENKTLKESLSPFIIRSIRSQIKFGIDTSVCYCIGSGENYKFLSQINEKYHFFKEIVPLEHPRFIMQYNKKRKNEFMDKYLSALRKH